MTRPRIAILVPELFYGGAETQFRHLIARLDRGKFDLTVIVEQSYAKTSRGEDQDFAREHGASAEFLFFDDLKTNSGFVRRLWSAARLSMRFRKDLRAGKYQLLLLYSALGLRQTLVARLSGVPTVLSERNAASYAPVAFLRKRVYFAAATRVICNSVPAVDNLRKRGVVSHYIPNGVSFSGTSEDRTTLFGETGLTLLVPARIATVKNQRLIVEALKNFIPRVNRLVLAGEPQDESYLEAIRATSAREGLDDHLVLPGFVSAMDRIYEKSDLVILPSFAEGTPNVLLEAMARGIPILASDIPSHRQVVADERLLFNPSSVDDFSRALHGVLSMSRADLDEIVRGHKDLVMTEYSLGAMVSAFEDVFLDLLRQTDNV